MRQILFAALLAGVPAWAYVRSVTTTGVPLFRPDAAAIRFLVNTSVQPGATNAQGQVTITPDSDPASALTAAALSWNAVDSSTARFLPLAMTSLSNNPADHNHVITIEDTPENRSVVGSLLAVTVQKYDAGGALTDTDIIINPTVSFSTNHTQGTFDLQSVITHELGHSLGASHSGVISATMFAAAFPFSQFITVAEATTEAALSADDVAFVTEVYPSADAGARFGTISGTVALANGRAVIGALVAALDPSTGVSVGALTSLTDGGFRIARLPPGNYLVYVHPLDGPVFPANLYLASSAVNATFRTTFFGGNASPSMLAIAAGGSAQANIVVDPAPTALTFPFLGIGPADGNGWSYLAGVNTVPSGGPVDLYLWGTGLDASVTSDQIQLLGPGMTIRPGSLTTAPYAVVSGMTALRFTVDIAPVSSRVIASIAIINGTDAAIYSGGLVLLPSPSVPAFDATGIGSAASLLPGAVAPGEIFTLYGSRFGPPALSQFVLNAAGRVSTLLSGTQVWFDGVAAPMVYAASGQLSAIVPYSVDGKSSTVVRVVCGGIESAPVTLPVVKSSPALFTSGSSGKGQAAILNQDASINLPSNPASIGDIVVLYGTGEGQTDPAGVDGQFATTVFPKPVLPVSVTIGGVSANVVYYGAAPQSPAGVLQINVAIPAGIAPGPAVPVTVSVGAATSPPGVTLAVK